MGLVGDMAAIAAECARTPDRTSIWSHRLGRYVCNKDPEYKEVQTSETSVGHSPTLVAHAPISPAFKLVFLTAAIGTLLFVLICVTTTLLAGKEPPPLTEKMTMAIFDLAKIGFGSVVGLLGGQALKG